MSPSTDFQTEGEFIVFNGDEYNSGKTIDLRISKEVLDGCIPLVRWTLPDGGRILGTLADYMKNMPIVFNNEESWRNSANAAKRHSMGMELDGDNDAMLNWYRIKRLEMGKAS